MGVAPPPPLRNIPHQTPDNSPVASLLFNQQKRQSLTVPTQRHSVPKLTTAISVLPTQARVNRQSLPDGFRASHPVMMVSPRVTSALPTQQRSGMTVDNEDLATTVTLPNHGVIAECETTRVIVSAPVSTSTPKLKFDATRVASSAPVSTAKRPLFQDAHGKRTVKHHQAAIHSEPELRKIDEGGEKTQESAPSNNHDNTVLSAELDHSEAGPSTAGEDIIAMHTYSDLKRKPLRAPSKLLQRNMSHELSSSQSSDVDTVSLDSDQSELRDRFDSGRLHQFNFIYIF